MFNFNVPAIANWAAETIKAGGSNAPRRLLY
jgi:hypothetical protein